MAAVGESGAAATAPGTAASSGAPIDAANAGGVAAAAAAAVAGLLGVVLDILAPIWVEVSFMIFFALGFSVLRLDLLTQVRKNWIGAGGSVHSGTGALRKASPWEQTHKTVEAEASSGNAAAALATWRSAKARAAAPIETLKLVTQMLVETAPGETAKEIVEHMSKHSEALMNGRTATAVLDVVARSGRVDIMEELADTLRERYHLTPTAPTYEALLGGYAAVGDAKKVSELCAEMAAGRQKMTARAYSLTIKGFLKNSMVDAAAAQIQAMQRHGYNVPCFAVTQLIRVACDGGRGEEVFEACATARQLSPDAVAAMLEHCHKTGDMRLGRRVELLAREAQVALPISAYDALLKLCVLHADLHALELFEEMQRLQLRISEGLCVGLLARCADSKFIRFAEDVARYVRSRDKMTIAVYSALMKVYAYSGMYDKACDLYGQICEEGLEPDTMMYGCLMKFAVECGRTDLSRELFEKAPQLDIQNYMSMIRAASRDRDVDKAFAVLEKLKASGAVVDNAAYNCVLDACVTARDMRRARQLMEQMRTINNLDIITYNTMLKGYCTQHDLNGAKELIAEMLKVGLKPNDVSYNCLINTAVCADNFPEAWRIIKLMEENDVAVDQYTISIMMKSLKKVRDPKDVAKALQLLDRTGLDVCSDEVMLNTVLETCIRHRELGRLQAIVTSFRSSGLRPSVHTYGSLIKSCSTLKRVDWCRDLWEEMVLRRALTPNNIVLGCMLDALVCNDCLEEAVALLEKWRTTVPPNTVMYSTIIKGFANRRQAARAMEMWKEMKEAKVEMNVVVFNVLVDAQARVGAMDDVSAVVESMLECGITPDVITYSTIVKGYCVKGDLDKAFEVFRSMQQNGMAADSIIYNTMLDGCTRHNRMDLADLVLEDFEKYKIKPSNFTLGILVKMHGRRGQLDKAFQVLEELPRRHGLQPNTQVKAALMSACLNNQDVKQALEVFRSLQAGPQGADAKAYGAMIAGMLRCGHAEEAVRLVEEAYGLSAEHGRAAPSGLPAGGSSRRSDATARKPGLPPSQQLEAEQLELLLRTLAQRGELEKLGVPLVKRLRAARVPISGRLLGLLEAGGGTAASMAGAAWGDAGTTGRRHEPRGSNAC